MKRMTKTTITRWAELAVWGIANAILGLLVCCIGFAMAVAFCHVVGLDTSWAQGIL